MFVGYATESWVDPNLDAQVSELVQAGCERIFTDGTTSGKIANRPGLSSALDYLRTDDTFVIVQLNRLDLPLKQLLGFLVMLEERGVAFQSLHDQIDPTTPEGQMLWHMLMDLAAFEERNSRPHIEASR